MSNMNYFDKPFKPIYYIYVDCDDHDINVNYNDHADTFVSWGRSIDPHTKNEALCIYKTNLNDGYDTYDPDTQEPHFYKGIETVNGIIYDKWQKYEFDTWEIQTSSGPVRYSNIYVLTKRIVNQNGEINEYMNTNNSTTNRRFLDENGLKTFWGIIKKELVGLENRITVLENNSGGKISVSVSNGVLTISTK